MKIYLDNAATTPLHPEALEKMLPFLKDKFGNPSSTHSYGREVRVAIEEAREKIALIINADPSEVYFTSGGTEAINFILNGITLTSQEDENRDEFICWNSEHKAVLEVGESLQKTGIKFSKATTEKGAVDFHNLSGKTTEKTSLLAVMFANNETGIVNNIASLAEIKERTGARIFTDAVQAFGKFPIDVKKLNIDAMSMSSHKINGPKGIGAAYIKNGAPLQSFMIGGPQERNRRGGTENPAAIIGFAEAAGIAHENLDFHFNHVSGLKSRFINLLENSGFSGITINSDDNSSPYILNLTLDSSGYKNDPEAMFMYLDLNGLAVSGGSACTSGVIKPSHVIKNLGYSDLDAAGTFRLSFGIFNTPDEIDQAAEIFIGMLGKFRK